MAEQEHSNHGGGVCAHCGGMVGEDGYSLDLDPKDVTSENDLDTEIMGGVPHDKQKKPSGSRRGMGESFADAYLSRRGG